MASNYIPTPPWERKCNGEGCRNKCRPHPQPGETPLVVRYWAQCKTCTACKQKLAAARSRRMRKSRAELRLCIQCADPLPPEWEHGRCPLHHAALAENQQHRTIRRRALGKCAMAGCPEVTESYRCARHAQIAASNRQQRKRTAAEVDSVIERVVALP